MSRPRFESDNVRQMCYRYNRLGRGEGMENACVLAFGSNTFSTCNTGTVQYRYLRLAIDHIRFIKRQSLQLHLQIRFRYLHGFLDDSLKITHLYVSNRHYRVELSLKWKTGRWIMSRIVVVILIHHRSRATDHEGNANRNIVFRIRLELETFQTWTSATGKPVSCLRKHIFQELLFCYCPVFGALRSHYEQKATKKKSSRSKRCPITLSITS
jgi:hypothetical protein